LAWLADYTAMLEMLASEDPYALFAAEMFDIPGLTKDTHPDHRQAGKNMVLGAGYGMSWAKLAASLLIGFLGAKPVLYDKAFAKRLGITGADVHAFLTPENMIKMGDIPHTCTDEEFLVHCVVCKRIIDKYRTAASPVVELWQLSGELLTHSLVNGIEYTHKVLTFQKGRIVMPNGMALRYPNLVGKPDEKGRVQWFWGDGKKLYSSKIVENFTQAVARIIMTDGLLRVQERYPVVHSAHDEGTAVVPEREADEAKAWIHAQMVKVPKWMPGIPLDASVGVGHTYREAKE